MMIVKPIKKKDQEMSTQQSHQPGHVDFSFKVIVVLCITDGALVVECVEYVYRHKQFPVRNWENIRLVLNVIEMYLCFLEHQVEGFFKCHREYKCYHEKVQ